MKAQRIVDWEQPALRLVDGATPRPGPEELLINVRFAPVSFADVLIASGRYQVRPRLPFSPGAECAGFVEQVGDAVRGFAPGDAVLAMGFVGNSRADARVIGSFAEKVVVRSANLVRAPAGIPLETAALVRGSYETAHYGLGVGRLQPEETLLVLGAGGGTGYAAVTLGKAAGARVIASASTPERRALARAAGADEVVDSRADDWRETIAALTDGLGVDVIYDPVGGAMTEQAFRSIGWGGRHVVIGFAAGDIPALPLNLPLLKGAAVIGANLLRYQELEPADAERSRAGMWRLLREGRLALPKIAGRFPLAQAGEALSLVARSTGAGRILIDMSLSDP